MRYPQEINSAKYPELDCCLNVCDPPYNMDDQKICPGPLQASGCPLAGTVVPKMSPDANGGLTCDTPCPTYCSEDQIPCSEPSNSNCPNTITETCYPRKVISSKYPDVECDYACNPTYNMDEQKICPGPTM